MTQVYAGRIKDAEVLKHCSSGGAFTALSDAFLNKGDAVLCSGYNYDACRAEFQLVLTKEERDQCRGSMYMQSFALDSWNEALDWLKANPEKQLIFFGTGCQGAAFRAFCTNHKVLQRVTVVDLVCHGVPSAMIWSAYAQSLAKGGIVTNINFRDKRTGWDKSSAFARQNDKEISLQKWRRVYSSRTMLRPSCASCPYTTTERDTDITIGDFWHLQKSMPDFYDDMGTSLFLIHTEKGVALFNSIKENIDYRESNTKDCWQMNLERPTQHAANRATFWADYRAKGIDYVMDKYSKVSLFKKALIKARKRFLNRGRV